MKVLHIISGNDDGGGCKHLINLCTNSKEFMECTIGCIGTGPLPEKARAKGVETVLFDIRSFFGQEALDYIAAKRFDIVNFHGAKAFLMRKLLGNRLHIPSVATVHSNYKQDFLNSKFKNIVYTPLSIMGLNSFDYFICVSCYIKKLMDVDGIEGRRFVIPNGIDLEGCIVEKDAESVRRELGINKDDFVYIMIARFHPVKNHATLIKAFAKLCDELKNVKLVLVGEGECRGKLQEEAGPGVIFTGYQENVIDLINASDISVLTSFSEGGALPLVILESAALKKTVVASSVSDMPYSINGGNGFLTDPNSEEDIYLKLKEAYLHQDRLKTMGENLYNYVKEKYSMDKFCKNYFNAYKTIIEDFEVVHK
ncbi:MAG: glycosyltransferase family 4 protein [Clostridiaceae bacterium]